MKQLIHILFFSLLVSPLWGQAHKAMKLYKDKRFAEAIPFFEKAIQKDPATKYQSKLAECYRKTNQLQKAAKTYEIIVQRKHFSSKTMLRYGEVLMGLGQYDEAKSWFLKYAEKNPKDPTGMLKAEACDYVKTIQPYFPKVEFIPIPFNSDADDSNPTLYKDKIYFSSDRSSGFNVFKKKSGWTGRDLIRIYSVDWQDSSLATPHPLPGRINNLNKNTGDASFSRKGDVFFTRNTNRISKDGTYKLHIFHSRLLPNGKWEKPEELSFCQLSINYLHPAISDDGKTLFFASNRKGGEGGMDLFSSHKTGSRWSIPVNLGSVINTPEHEIYPYIHPSGKLFFSSKGHNGFGGYDIFVSTKNEHGFWQKPINLGQPINSSGDDVGFYADSLMQLALFSSTRNSGNDDIFMCRIDTTSLLAQKNNPIDSTSTKPVSTIPTDSLPVLSDEQIKEKYQQEFLKNDLQLMAGDTVYLVSPQYHTDEVDVPDFLRKQLDLLIPAMYLSNDLQFFIYSFNDEGAQNFSKERITTLRAQAIGDYLTEKHILPSKIFCKGYSLENSQNFPTFADPNKVIILVRDPANQ